VLEKVAPTGQQWRSLWVSGVSPAAGLKVDQSNRKRNFEKANIEHRTSNIE
jgi:hypothetical protein